MRLHAILLALVVCTRLIAQDDGARLGFKVAPNLAWLRSDEKELDGDGSRLGFTWGLMCDIPFGAKGVYALHLGLFHNSIGGKFKSAYTHEGAQVAGSYDLKLTYLEMPFALKMRTSMEKPLNYYGLVGMNGALNLKARADYSSASTVGGTTTTTTLDDENVTDEIAAFKLGFQVGAGAEFEVSSMTIVAGLTYNSGLTNVLDKDAKKLFGDGEKRKMLADYLELTIGLYF